MAILVTDALEIVKQPTHHQSRLADKLVSIVHSACDNNDLEVARDLLKVLNKLMRKNALSDRDRRRVGVSIVTAHERLWSLRHGKTVGEAVQFQEP